MRYLREIDLHIVLMFFLLCPIFVGIGAMRHLHGVLILVSVAIPQGVVLTHAFDQWRCGDRTRGIDYLIANEAFLVLFVSACVLCGRALRQVA